jgi:hypothetical protein
MLHRCGMAAVDPSKKEKPAQPKLGRFKFL